MAAIGITGGVASGKSTFTSLLAETLGAAVFDSDQFVHHLLEESTETIAAIRENFGDQVMTEDGKVDRRNLGTVVFADQGRRRSLEAIIHPRVRQAWQRERERHETDAQWLLIDIPLLFETEAERELPATVLVGCSRQVQLERLQRVRGLSAESALRMIDAQMEMTEKVERAAWVVWNDGSREALHRQTHLLANLLNAQ